ncbi:hypothetical protein Tco_0598684 [Tanacetum coccineum]
MTCLLPHTIDEIQALVQKLIDEDIVRQKVIMELSVQFDNASTSKGDMRKAYKKCNDISQESRALICTFLKEEADKDYEINLSMRVAGAIPCGVDNVVNLLSDNADLKGTISYCFLSFLSAYTGCDTFSAVTLPDEDNTVPDSELPVALANSMDVYVPLKIQSSLDAQMMMVENAAAYSECTEKDADIEKGKSQTPSTNEETLGDLKNEEEQMFDLLTALQKSLQKQISFEMGGKCMQLPKFSTRAEKVLEAPRMRKYKRTASFNSRKVALLFSVLRMQTIGNGSRVLIRKKGGVILLMFQLLIGVNYVGPTWKFVVICSALGVRGVVCCEKDYSNCAMGWSKVYMVRAKELFTWTPSFDSIKEQDYSSDDESVQGVGSKENKYKPYEKERMSMEHSVHVDKEISADPFGLNDLLGLKKPVEENLEPSPSLSHPPGFSPVGSLNSSDKELNKEFSPTISAKVMNNSQVVHEDVSFNSVGGSGNNKGGSVLGVLDEMIRVGRAMGYSMEGCEKDIESIINSKGDEVFSMNFMSLNIQGIGEQNADMARLKDPILVKKAFKDHYEARFNKPTKARLKLSFSFPNRLSTDQLDVLEALDSVRLGCTWIRGILILLRLLLLVNGCRLTSFIFIGVLKHGMQLQGLALAVGKDEASTRNYRTAEGNVRRRREDAGDSGSRD